MATDYFKRRFTKALEEAFADAVEYTPFDEQGNTDPDTGEVDNDAAYLGLSTTLPALVDLSPSRVGGTGRAVRGELGREQDFDGTILLANATLIDLNITLKIGDRFVVAPDSEPYYVEKILPGYQSGGEFLGRTVAVSHRVGRR